MVQVMWPKKYKDYPADTPIKKECVASGHGIIGCEMHEISGWGESLHMANAKKRVLSDAPQPEDSNPGPAI
jgi:hypothetical protein